MKIRFYAVIFIVIALLFSFTACKAKPSTTSSDSAPVESITTASTTRYEAQTTTPTTLQNIAIDYDLSPISAKLAQLTHEDGTGTFTLGSSMEKLTSILKANNISYTYYPEGTNAFTENVMAVDGTMYIVETDNNGGKKISSIFFNQTFKGLKDGVPQSKVISLFGEPFKRSDSNDFYYITNYFPKENEVAVLFITFDNNNINWIVLSRLTPGEKTGETYVYDNLDGWEDYVLQKFS
ncbi:MAG: hypothetical protein LBS74_08295 [Oscillospiraceae bacterium]|jgi:hypothetical protein|nr:hypothetical protein [Oscillospiraceae bacterium]